MSEMGLMIVEVGFDKDLKETIANNLIISGLNDINMEITYFIIINKSFLSEGSIDLCAEN
jgi:hypothetical protein